MEVKRLENELTIEIKRRTEMNKSTQAVKLLRLWPSITCTYWPLFIRNQWFEEQLATINTNFHDAIEERDERSRKKLEVLENRITALGEHFETEKATILTYIEERGRELTKMLNEFKARYSNLLNRPMP